MHASLFSERSQFVVFVAIISLTICGCGGSTGSELANLGKSTMFQAGVLGFDIECIPVLAGDSTAVDVYWGVPPSSLTFTRSANGFQSLLDIDIHIFDKDPKVPSREFAWAETTTVQAYAQTQEVEPIEKARRIAISPGSWVIQVMMEDTHLKTRASRVESVVVPDPRGDAPSLGKMAVDWREPGGSVVPYVFFHIPSGLDSLHASVPLYNFPHDAPADFRFVIERFKTDTLTPVLPFLISNIRPARLWHTPEDDGAPDTVRVVQTVFPPPIAPAAHFPIPLLSPGLYRLTVTVRIGKGAPTTGDTVLKETRIASIKGVTFPHPGNLSELINALAYIAKPDELNLMLAAKTPQEQRDQFDLFWLRRTGDRASAANLIREYATRVEEANRYFSTFNEGWKTDRGMIYIVLGPPVSITNSPDSQTWIFDYPGATQSNVFTFTISHLEGDGITLNEYVLDRQSGYENLWNRLVDRWRTGQMY